MNQEMFLRARRFALQRARPIDHARWCFHFEGAAPKDVLDILSQHQNADGGFGHALEADFWNPSSSPMQTWAATELIHSLNCANENHPIILGILSYLESGDDFNGRTWNRTIESNNDYPRAEWWTHNIGNSERVEATYNPTASLAGFALRFSRIGSRLHEKAEKNSSDALEVLLGATTIEVHELSCFLRLLDCIAITGTNRNTDLNSVERKIGKLINESITRDTSRWKNECVCRPSRFFRTRTDRFFPRNEKIASFECKFLEETQLEDGSWPVAWSWAEFPSEWPVAKEWWKSAIVIENLLFLKNFEDETEA